MASDERIVGLGWSADWGARQWRGRGENSAVAEGAGQPPTRFPLKSSGWLDFLLSECRDDPAVIPCLVFPVLIMATAIGSAIYFLTGNIPGGGS